MLAAPYGGPVVGLVCVWSLRLKLEMSLGGGASRLAAIWEEFNTSDSLPDRADFTLSRLGALTSRFMALRAGEHGELVVVQSGTAIDHIWGRNVVGASSGTMSLKFGANLSCEEALAALNQPCGIHVSRTLEKSSGNKLKHETLYLPVVSKRGRQLVSITDFAAARHMYGLLGDTTTIVNGEMHFSYFVDVGYGVPDVRDMRVA